MWYCMSVSRRSRTVWCQDLRNFTVSNGGQGAEEEVEALEVVPVLLEFQEDGRA